MSYDDEIVSYLAGPTNLEVALDVYDAVSKIPDYLENRFWEGLRGCLESLMQKEGVQNWKIQITTCEDMKKDYFGWRFMPAQPTANHSKYLAVTILKEGAKVGVGISVEGLSEPGSYEGIEGLVRPLKEKIQKSDSGYEILKEWWVCWKLLDKAKLNDRPVLMQISRNSYQEQMANAVWKFFEEYRDEMERINIGINEGLN